MQPRNRETILREALGLLHEVRKLLAELDELGVQRRTFDLKQPFSGNDLCASSARKRSGKSGRKSHGRNAATS